MTDCSVLELMVMVMMVMVMRPRASVVSMLDTGMGGWLCGDGVPRLYLRGLCGWRGRRGWMGWVCELVRRGDTYKWDM